TDINSGPGDGITFTRPLQSAVADGKLFFAANDGTHGSRLWMSDGTTDGTMQVSNLSIAQANPTQAIANVNGSLFFEADDGIHGAELWIIPAEQLAPAEKLAGGHHHHDDGGKHSHGGEDRGPANAAPAALTSNGPTVMIAPAP